MCGCADVTKLSITEPDPTEEDTMHPDIATELGRHRQAELVAEAAHHRLVRAARQDRQGRRRRTERRWLWVLQPS
jgi:hypothetical protein